MLTITITGERAEGKTHFANLIYKLLKAFIDCQISLRESETPPKTEAFLRECYSKISIEEMRKSTLPDKEVKIVVVNTKY